MDKKKIFLIIVDVLITVLAAIFATYMVMNILTIIEQRTEDVERNTYQSVKAYNILGEPMFEWEKDNLTAEVENGLVKVTDNEGNAVALYGVGGIVLE